MTPEPSTLPDQPHAKPPWTAPHIKALQLNAAQGADSGALCDKYGSLSATSGNDRCQPLKP
jgi:hypothetical protein